MKSRKQIGINNKRKGSNAERYYANVFRELGYEFCKTSRQASRLHDNAKIDLMYIPYNIQIKAGVHKNMNPGKVLLELKANIVAYFPPEDEVHKKPAILIHRKESGIGNKRKPEHDIVYMSLEQFNYFNSKNNLFQYNNSKEIKLDMNSEFRIIVSMTFEHFKEEIILKKII